MEFFVDKHKIYGSIAGALMVLVICFPFVLIFYPARKSQHLETLRACYKTRWHPFVAYYLVCRVMLLAISTYMPAGPSKSAWLQFCCIFFLFIVAVVRPYKEANEAGEVQGVATQREAGEAQGVAAQGGNEIGEAPRVSTQGSNVAGEVQGVANQGGDEAEAQGVANQGGDEAEAQRVANQGGNEAGEAQGVANQGGNEAQEAGEETVGNKWINESDTAILATLSAIAVLSSGISSDVSLCNTTTNDNNSTTTTTSTECGLMWTVWILAWVPLVMAFLPYALRYLRRRRCCNARDEPNDLDERTPLLHGRQQQGVPNEAGPNVNEPTPALGGGQQRSVPNEPDPQINQRIPLLDADEFYTAPEQQDVPNGPDGDLQVNLRTPLLGVDNDDAIYQTASESLII
ncbi:hypothetical protein OS493_011495 [Desmophyllum pertusum]|uniref:Uncharacterized protein n=1 Tax=Desmophyllum pertusum TaxID=174260 RepID=A0A9W9YTL5_9CNID|nr:hypothetical protein OS493_011495 [Desmophyllum pertusum]